MIDSDEDASTVDLVKEALDDARELIKLEVALAKQDIESEVTQARSAAIALAIAALASSVVLAMVLFAVAYATHAEVAVTVTAAIVLFAIAAVAASTGVRKMPSRFLGRTRQRLGEDLRELGERPQHGT